MFDSAQRGGSWAVVSGRPSLAANQAAVL